MQDLKVIGVEDGACVAVGDDGERFRIAIDEALQSKVRQFGQEASAAAPKLSPREMQAHIRSGMSRGRRRSGHGRAAGLHPAVRGPDRRRARAHRRSALSVPVHTAVDVDPLGEGNTFGAVIRDRLASLGVAGRALGELEGSEAGWIVKLEFTADQIDHDARWSYDARKHALAPLNSEAMTLSQAGELKGALIPRLRAVDAARLRAGRIALRQRRVHVPRAAERPARARHRAVPRAVVYGPHRHLGQQLDLGVGDQAGRR